MSSQGVLTKELPALLPAFPQPRGLSPHTPSINQGGGKAPVGTLLWSPQPVPARAQSACSPRCLTFSCLPHWHLQSHKGLLFSLFASPRAWFSPKGQRAVPVPFSKPILIPLLNILSCRVQLQFPGGSEGQCTEMGRGQRLSRGSHGLWRSWCPAPRLPAGLGCSRFSPGHLAAPVLPTGLLWELMNTGSPSFT